MKQAQERSRAFAEIRDERSAASATTYGTSIDPHGTILEIHPASLASTIGVEWVRIKGRFETDLELAEHFKACGLVLLPGRQFHWSKTGPAAYTDAARFELLKPQAEFTNAIEIIRRELRTAEEPKVT